MAQIKMLDFSTGKPVVVRIIDYIEKELNSEGEYNMILQDQALLAESKRLNDEMKLCIKASPI